VLLLLLLFELFEPKPLLPPLIFNFLFRLQFPSPRAKILLFTLRKIVTLLQILKLLVNKFDYI